MKNKVSSLVKILGIGINELVIDIELQIFELNSIEYDESEDKIYLHIFEGEDTDITIDFEDIDEDDQLTIYVVLSSILYN